MNPSSITIVWADINNGYHLLSAYYEKKWQFDPKSYLWVRYHLIPSYRGSTPYRGGNEGSEMLGQN